MTWGRSTLLLLVALALTACPTPPDCTLNSECAVDEECSADGTCTPIADADGGSPEPDDGGVPDGGSPEPEPEPGDGGVDDVVITNFEADSPIVAAGANVTLTWTVANADTCTLNGTVVAGVADARVPSDDDDNTDGDVTYTLECTGGGGPVSATVDVGYVLAELNAVGMNTQRNAGDNDDVFSFTGSSIPATATCVLREGDAEVDISGTFTPDADTTYTYSCTRDGVTHDASVDAQVASVVITGNALVAAQDGSYDVAVSGSHVADCTVAREGEGSNPVDLDTPASFSTEPFSDVAEETVTATCMGFDSVVTAEHTMRIAGFTTDIPGWLIDQGPASWMTRHADTTCTAAVADNALVERADAIDIAVTKDGVNFTIDAPVHGYYYVDCSLTVDADTVTFGAQLTGEKDPVLNSATIHVVDTASGNPEVAVDVLYASYCSVDVDGSSRTAFDPTMGEVGDLGNDDPGDHTVEVSCDNTLGSTPATASLVYWKGNITPANYGDVPASGVVAVDGDVDVSGGDATTVTDLSKLDGIVEVSGQVRLQGLAPGITAIGGGFNTLFDALRLVGGDFTFEGNPTLQVTFASLVSVGGAFEVNTNASLTTLTASELVSVEGAFEVNTNASLTTLTASELVSVEGAFSLSSNDLVDEIELGKLVSVGGDMTIDGDALERIRFLLLESIDGGLSILDCTVLEDLRLPVLATVNGLFEVRRNPSLCQQYPVCIADRVMPSSQDVGANDDTCSVTPDPQTCLQ